MELWSLLTGAGLVLLGVLFGYTLAFAARPTDNKSDSTKIM